jgi:hypothetical protein
MLYLFCVFFKVGVAQLPLDGNPARYAGVMAHPSAVTRIAVSHDGAYIFTADAVGAIHVWTVYPAFLASAVVLGGDGITPFVNLLEGAGFVFLWVLFFPNAPFFLFILLAVCLIGGLDGALFAEMQDYFYFTQLQYQGLKTRKARKVGCRLGFFVCLPAHY